MEASAFAQFSELNLIISNSLVGKHWKTILPMKMFLKRPLPWVSQLNISGLKSNFRSTIEMVNHQNCDWGQMPHRHGSSDPLYNDVQRFTRKTCPFQRQSDKATLKRSDQNLSNPSNSIPNIKQLVGYAPCPFWAKHNRTCNMSGEPQVTWHVRTVVQPHWPLALAYMSRDVTSHKNPKHSWHDLSCPRCIDGKMMKHVLDSLSTHVISKVSLVYKGNNHWNTPKTGDFGSQLV